MAKIISFGLLLFFFSSSMAKPNNESEQETLNRLAKETDTIFVGRALKEMVIKDGLVYDNGDSFSLVISELQVLKNYRGKKTIDKKQLICFWYTETGEFAFYPTVMIGRDLLIFGFQVGSTVQLPLNYQYIRGIPKDESRIYKALRLKQKNIKDKSNIFSTFYPNNKIIRNACNEPITRKLQ